MMRFAGWAVSATLVLAALPVNAQMLAPYRGVSDFDGPYERPYAAVPPAPPPVYNYGGGYGPGPALMPPQEVYAVLRDNGFSPLGVPHQRGFVYFIAAIDHRGESGRLVIDARNGQILRFAPSYGYGPGPYGGNLEMEPMSGYGPDPALPPPTVIRGSPQASAQEPHQEIHQEPRVASRAVPLPTPKPAAAARPPGPAPQQSAAVETRPATPPAPAASASHPAQSQTQPAPAAQASNSPPPSTATAGETRPTAPAIRPTQQMPPAQGLE
jgi:hypothetical protein